MLIYSALLISTAVMMKLQECNSKLSLLTCGFLSFQWLSLVSIKQTECCILCFSILCFCTLAWLFRHFAGNSSSPVPSVHSSKSAWAEKQQKSQTTSTEPGLHSGFTVDSIFNSISTVSLKHSAGCQGMHELQKLHPYGTSGIWKCFCIFNKNVTKSGGSAFN